MRIIHPYTSGPSRSGGRVDPSTPSTRRPVEMHRCAIVLHAPDWESREHFPDLREATLRSGHMAVRQQNGVLLLLQQACA